MSTGDVYITSTWLPVVVITGVVITFTKFSRIFHRRIIRVDRMTWTFSWQAVTMTWTWLSVSCPVKNYYITADEQHLFLYTQPTKCCRLEMKSLGETIIIIIITHHSHGRTYAGTTQLGILRVQVQNAQFHTHYSFNTLAGTLWDWFRVPLGCFFLHMAMIEVNLWVLTGNPMDFLETKPANQDASEYHPNQCHIEGGGSTTHPEPPQGLHIST